MHPQGPVHGGAELAVERLEVGPVHDLARLEPAAVKRHNRHVHMRRSLVHVHEAARHVLPAIALLDEHDDGLKEPLPQPLGTVPRQSNNPVAEHVCVLAQGRPGVPDVHVLRGLDRGAHPPRKVVRAVCPDCVVERRSGVVDVPTLVATPLRLARVVPHNRADPPGLHLQHVRHQAPLRQPHPEILAHRAQRCSQL